MIYHCLIISHLKVPSTTIKLCLFLLNLSTKATVELIGNMVECVSEVKHCCSGHYCRRPPPTTVNKLTASVVIKASNIWANLLLQMSYPVFMTKLQDEENIHPIQKQSSGKKEEKNSLSVTSPEKIPCFSLFLAAVATEWLIKESLKGFNRQRSFCDHGSFMAALKVKLSSIYHLTT